MNGFVSIIIPTYNRSLVLIRAIESVFRQTYTNYELIIVDDGSTDETYSKLLPLIDKKSITYLKQPNRGVAPARNHGLRMAQGEWITFLDSDDEWLPQKLQEQLSFLTNHPEFQIAYTDEIWIRNGVRVNAKKIHQKIAGDIFDKCLELCFIAPSSVIIHKSLLQSMNGFNEEFVVCEDYDLWLRISLHHRVGLITAPLIIKHGGHQDQLSTKYFAMDMWRLKSMEALFHSQDFSNRPNERKALLACMEKKAAILSQGYLKHGNFEAYELVQQILRRFIIK